ncbi:MAG: hypothetical protein LBM16_01685, partial [Clostridiales bacterium]|nr:hypothetical protein [Clostridiales bacterium]
MLEINAENCNFYEIADFISKNERVVLLCEEEYHAITSLHNDELESHMELLDLIRLKYNEIKDESNITKEEFFVHENFTSQTSQVQKLIRYLFGQIENMNIVFYVGIRGDGIGLRPS